MDIFGNETIFYERFEFLQVFKQNASRMLFQLFVYMTQ